MYTLLLYNEADRPLLDGGGDFLLLLLLYMYTA